MEDLPVFNSIAFLRHGGQMRHWQHPLTSRSTLGPLNPCTPGNTPNPKRGLKSRYNNNNNNNNKALGIRQTTCRNVLWASEGDAGMTQGQRNKWTDLRLCPQSGRSVPNVRQVIRVKDQIILAPLPDQHQIET